MAQEALKKLEEQLTCSICLNTYTDPKLLQCFHVYCRQCLVPLVVRDQQGDLGIPCPICRQVTPVPERGVTCIQSAFHINHLLEIYNDLPNLQGPGVAGDVAVENIPKKTVHHCLEHAGKELTLYCGECERLVCVECVHHGEGRHHGHINECRLLEDAFKKYEDDITQSLKPLEEQVATLEETLVKLDIRREEVSQNRDATEGNVHLTFSQLREVLNIREIELISQIDEINRGKLDGLATQQDQIANTLAQRSSCLHFLKESLKEGHERGNKEDVLMMKANTMEQMSELTTPFSPEVLKPNTEADMMLLASADFTGACRNYGQVVAPSGLPDPSNYSITGEGVKAAVVSEESTVILRAINFRDEEVSKSLECGLVSEIRGTEAICDVKRSRVRCSQHEIRYQPMIKGRHQLHVKLDGHHVRGSPFKVAVQSPIKDIGIPILTIQGVEEPWGVAVNQAGEVVVSEAKKNRIVVFSSRGEKLRSFGSDEGELYAPQGVAVDSEGNILVADCKNNRIQKFTSSGSFVRSTTPDPRFRLSYPTNVAVNSANNKVYITDTGNSRVVMLNSDFTFISTFGDHGQEEGQFDYLCGVACDTSGNVYVADTNNHRIQVFTAQGKFLRAFGEQVLGKIPCVAVDKNDIVYVSEHENHRVSVFTSEGMYVRSFGENGVGPGQFGLLRAVAVDDSGVIYVCDCVNNCVQAF